MQKYYKFQYRFNASHTFDYDEAHAHMHTFTLTLYLGKKKEGEQIEFSALDKSIEQYLGRFEHCYLNDEPEFEELTPNIENMGEVFFEAIGRYLIQTGVVLYQLDIYENPTSIYQVSKRIHLPACYVRDVD